MLVTVPFMWDEHEKPYDYGRYTSFGLKHLFNKNSFEVINFEKSTPGIECIFQLLICYIEKKIFTKSIYINYFFKLFIISPINLLAIVFNFVIPKNYDMYLDNVLLVKKSI